MIERKALMGTCARINTAVVVFHLRVSPASGEDARTVIVDSSEILDNEHHRITFPRIPESAGKQYYFFIESTGSAPGNAVTIYYSAKDVYDAGSAFFDGKQISGDLAFRVYSEMTLQEAMTCFHAKT